MPLADDLKVYTANAFKKDWKVRTGQVVPDPTGLSAANDAIEFDRATVLYADLSGSTFMVDNYHWIFSAAIYKSFLYCAARLITNYGGVITAYDGDRVMGIFVGGSQSTAAAECAFRICSAAYHVITPAMKAAYPETPFVLKHVVGIDTSPIKVAKTGVRGENDLVWIGRAANYAAKLTEINMEFKTWITAAVFDQLNDAAKYHGNPKEFMWKKHNWDAMGKIEIYGSTWWRAI